MNFTLQCTSLLNNINACRITYIVVLHLNYVSSVSLIILIEKKSRYVIFKIFWHLETISLQYPRVFRMYRCRRQHKLWGIQHCALHSQKFNLYTNGHGNFRIPIGSFSLKNFKQVSFYYKLSGENYDCTNKYIILRSVLYNFRG